MSQDLGPAIEGVQESSSLVEVLEVEEGVDLVEDADGVARVG